MIGLAATFDETLVQVRLGIYRKKDQKLKTAPFVIALTDEKETKAKAATARVSVTNAETAIRERRKRQTSPDLNARSRDAAISFG